MNESISESLTYVQDEPDIKTLRFAYEQPVTELDAYLYLCRTRYYARLTL